MSESQRSLVKREATRRGWRATFAGVISVGAVGTSVGLGAPIIVTLLFAVAGVSFTGTKVAQWLRYRGENGLRF